MEEFCRENLFWREVASCYCDDLSLTLSSAADHFRSREIGFFYRVNCAKRTSAGQQVVLHYYLVPLVLLEWPCDRDFLWIYIIFSLIVCFSDINRKIGQRIFDCATVDVWAARVIALICQRLQDIFPIIFSSFPVLCSILWFCQKDTLTSIWCHSWSLNWILMSNFYLSR